VTEEHLVLTEEIFKPLGKTLRVPEAQQGRGPPRSSGFRPGLLLPSGRGDDRRGHPCSACPRQVAHELIVADRDRLGG